MPNPDLKRAAVLGWPVSHSLSPRLHAYWFKQHGIEGSYDALPIAPEQLELLLGTLPDKGFVGVNLTIPHKEAALTFVDEADEIARKIGAVNTIIVKGNRLLGTNTDAYGFMENLKANAKNIRPGKALVLGAGGSARAICAGLVKEKWHVSLAGRTRVKAEAIGERLGELVTIIDWEKNSDAMADVSLLVNTTPLGMKGQSPLTLSLETLPKSAVVYDIVYNPIKTLLLAEAEARGNPVVTGLGMLIYQGQKAFEMWFGVKPDVTKELRTHMLEVLA